MDTNYVTRDNFGMYARNNNEGPGPSLMGANTLRGNDVYNNDHSAPLGPAKAASKS